MVFNLFLPGIEQLLAREARGLPALERLIGRAQVRPLESSPWAFLAALHGGSLARWPVGPVSACGELDDPPANCLRVEPLGMNEDEGSFRLPATALAISPDEAGSLALAFNQMYEAEGWQLEIGCPERWYLAWGPDGLRNEACRGCAAPAVALAAEDRPAPVEPGLRRLVSEVEMLFHAHPVNVARRAQGLPTIASIHCWGGGSLESAPRLAACSSRCGSEPYLAGLRRLGVLRRPDGHPVAVPELPSDGVAWPMPAENLSITGLEAVEQALAERLLVALQRGRIAAVRVVTQEQVFETRRSDLWRVWRRPRKLAELCR